MIFPGPPGWLPHTSSRPWGSSQLVLLWDFSWDGECSLGLHCPLHLSPSVGKNLQQHKLGRAPLFFSTTHRITSPDCAITVFLSRLLVLWLNFCTALRPQTTCCQEAIPLPKTHPSRRRVLSPSLPWEEEDTHKRADQRIDSPLLMNGPLLVFWLTQRCAARSASH
jgi:hypothetical protein